MPGAGNAHETFGRPDQGIEAFAECKGNYTIVFAVNYQHLRRCLVHCPTPPPVASRNANERLHLLGDRASVFAGLARHGRPIQYAHEPEPLALWDVWTKIASDPIAFESPSAGFALDWRTQSVWRQRGVGFATLTHAAGISSTGDPALDSRLPFDEPYRIPWHTALAINDIKSKGGRIVAVGTSVVRALESAANADGTVRVGNGVARGRIRRNTAIRVADAILTGVHRPGESHFELLEAFVDDPMLAKISNALIKYGYRPHEFGDSMLIERRARTACRCSADKASSGLEIS